MTEETRRRLFAAFIGAPRGLETMRAAPRATVEMNASFLAAARVDGELITKGRLTFDIRNRRE